MAIQLVNRLNSTDDRIICSEDELLFETEEIIRSLDRWVKQEGSSLLCRSEVDAQRNIAIRFHNLLLEKYNKSDIHTRFERETQELDGTRTDFQVYHGFFGPVIIELKLSTHSELQGGRSLKKTRSFDSMKKYMLQFNAKNGILLIYKHQSTEDETFEKILHNTKDEIPHSVAVEIINVETKKDIRKYDINIYVERESQKGIVIGKEGSLLKKIGIDSRKEIEALIDLKVNLKLWVKVKKKWRKNQQFLNEMGYKVKNKKIKK